MAPAQEPRRNPNGRQDDSPANFFPARYLGWESAGIIPVKPFGVSCYHRDAHNEKEYANKSCKREEANRNAGFRVGGQ